MNQANNFLFESLNNAQRKAVSHVNGPLLVVAGAGSGKTKTLTHRIANLIENNIDFIIDPYIRFKGEVGEQATMFFLDPSGNALEFKSFKDPGQVFAK